MHSHKIRNPIPIGVSTDWRRWIIIPLLLIAVIAGCSTLTHVKKNVSDFHEFTLKNGIPVFVKIAEHNRINALSLALKGGGSYTPQNVIGIEEMTLALALYESEKFTNMEKRTILKETSAAIFKSVGLDYTIYGLKSIDKYFSRTFELYADLLINPRLSEKYFKEVKTNMINGFKSELTDGYSRVSLAINREFLKDHPYEATLGNLQSYQKLTLDDIKTHYKNNITAARILIVAVGNYDISRLKMKLDTTFGNLPKGEYQAPVLHRFTKERTIPLILDPTEHLRKDVSFVRCNLYGPDFNSSEYWATVLAFRMLNDILSDKIRTKEGMVYSMFSYSLNKISNYSQISAYQTNNPVKIIDLINESINILAEGKCLTPNISSSAAGKGEIGGIKTPDKMALADYVPIDEVLEFYKASFETGYFQGLEENLQIAGRIIEYELKTGNYKNYLRTTNQIEGISSADIIKATNEFIKKPTKYCAVSANPLTIKKLEENHASYSSEFIKVVLE